MESSWISRLDIIDSSPTGHARRRRRIGGGPVDDARERGGGRARRLDEMAEMVQGAARSLSAIIGGELDEEARPWPTRRPCAALTRLARPAPDLRVQERADDAAEARAAGWPTRQRGAGRRALCRAERSGRQGRFHRGEETPDPPGAQEANHERGPPGLPRPEREGCSTICFSDYERYDDFDRDVATSWRIWARGGTGAGLDRADSPGFRPRKSHKAGGRIERRLLHMSRNRGRGAGPVRGNGFDEAWSTRLSSSPGRRKGRRERWIRNRLLRLFQEFYRRGTQSDASAEKAGIPPLLCKLRVSR